MIGLGILACFALISRSMPQQRSSSGRVFQRFKSFSPIYGSYQPHNSASSCRLNMSSLEPYGLTKEFSYTRRYIKQVPFESGPNSRAPLSHVDELSDSIFTGLDYLTMSSNDQGNAVDLQHCTPEPMKMYMRHNRKPVDGRHLVFGMATTAERLLEFASTTALWLANTGARLIVIVPTGPKVQELRDHLFQLGIKATVLTSNDDFLVNYFKLVEAFHAHGDPGSKWFTFVDDDTHYFSLQRFIEALQIYDPNKEVYIGNPSEDLRQMRVEGLFAFGGAGITVSKGLLGHLHQEYYSCLAGQQTWEPGDVRLKKCVYQHTETKLTMVEGLHQLDLIGESLGLLEGPRPPITWHHYRSWSIQPVDTISKAGQVCGGACLFQRWKFPIPSDFGYAFMTFHFGVSIVGYSVGIRPDLGKTETTWVVYPESNFDHSIAPLRMGLQEGRDRFTYRLKGISHDINGHVKHTYIKYVDRERLRLKAEIEYNGTQAANADTKSAPPKGKEGDIDEVMELIFV